MSKLSKKVDAVQMSLLNKREVLQLIRNEGIISRTDIGNITGLTAPTVSRIVEHLVTQEKLVEYTGVGESSGGRRPVMLKFSGKDSYVIGIDLGATFIRGVLSDLEANFLTEIHVPTAINEGFEAIMDQIADLVEKLLNRKDFDSSHIRGIGIAIAGLVNKSSGIVDYSPDFGWRNVNVKESLSKRISIPFIFDNSSRLMALGEYEYGEGRKYDNIIVLNIGYGIAAGIIIEGMLLKGGLGYAGEFGHTVAEPNSKIPCKCGAFGCLEAMASGRRIAQLGQEVAQKHPNNPLFAFSGGNISKIDAKMVAAAAKQGDPDALHIFEEITTYLAVGVANLVNLLDPQHIYIGGGVSLNGDVFFENLSIAIQKHLIMPEKNVHISPATFRENASLIGAFSLVANRIFNFEPFDEQTG
jgi:glucokinase-like ROK family protein